MNRDKSHIVQVERWANYIKRTPKEVWKKGFNDFINSQFDIANKFYKNLEKTEKGREIFERLKKERLKVKTKGIA